MECDAHFLLVTKYQLLAIGLWPKVGSFKILYSIYSILVRYYFLLFILTFVLGSFLALPSLTSYERADVLCYILVHFLAVWKIFLTRSKSMRKLINDVVVFEKRLKGTNSNLEAIYKKESTNNFKLIIYLPLVTSFCLVCILWATLIDYFEWKSLEKEGMESGKHFIFPQLVPYPDKYFDSYYGQQVFAALVGSCYVGLVDSLILTLINYTIMRFKILGAEMENLFKNKGKDLEETKALLRNKILTHKAIISHVIELNENLRWYFFIDFTVKSYQISLALLAFFDEATYLIPKRWLIFKVTEVSMLFLGSGVLYFQANKITNESEELSTAIYKSDWIGQPTEIVKSLMIMMVRSKRALKLESFGIVILSCDLFLNICKASYTFVVLQLAGTK